MKKRIISLLLAAVMILALASCANNTETSSPSAEVSEPETSAAPSQDAPAPTDAAPTDGGPAVGAPDDGSPIPGTLDNAMPADPMPDLTIALPIVEDTLTYTIWTGVSPDLSQVISDINDFSVFAEMEKRTNIHLEGTVVSAFAEQEQFNLMIVSEEYCDIINGMGGYTGGVDKAIEDEIIIDIWPLVQQYMPNYMAALTVDDSVLLQALSNEGQMGCFYGMFVDEKPADAGALIRQDWLDDLGLKAPETYDEIYDMLMAFKTEKDADAALIIPGDATPGDNCLLGGYNVNEGWYQVNGEVRYGVIQNDFKEYLQMINQWYDDGLIWSEFVNLNEDRLMDFSTILTNRTGMWFGGVQDMQNVNEQAEDEGFRCYALADTVKNAGDVTHLGTVPAYINSNTWALSTACHDLEPILKYIDYMYSDEGTLLCNYGVEGEGYNIGEDGKPHLSELVTNNPDGLPYRVTVAMYCFDKMNSVPFKLDNSKSYASYTDDQMAALGIWGTTTDGAYNMPQGVSLTAEETEEYTRVFADIETFVEENIMRFVLGDKSFDEWDGFVAQIKEMNIDFCQKLQQGAYDRYVSKELN